MERQQINFAGKRVIQLNVASGQITSVVRPNTPRFAATSRLSGQTPQPPPTTQHGSVKRVLGTEYSAFNVGGAMRSKYARANDKSKGLRHFSTKVCEKVKAKQHTNYNEVADELVQEYFDGLPTPPVTGEKQSYDMKNIRRRVYDALNVLMAMNIIEKEKKEIRWVGLPTSTAQEFRRIDEEKSKRVTRIKQKTEQLHDLINQLVAYKSLLERNRERERNEGRPADNTISTFLNIIVNTNKKTLIDCAISHDKTEYLFNFDQPFEIHDDIEVLKRLGLAFGLDRGEVTPEHREKIKSYLPAEALRPFIDQFFDGSPLRRQALPPPPVQDKKPLIPIRSISGHSPNSGGGNVVYTTSGARPVVTRTLQPPSGQQTKYAVLQRSSPANQQTRYVAASPVSRQVAQGGAQGGTQGGSQVQRYIYY
ncbi:hypothetical protein L596_016825 [Steinernema carpocapsae]|uniref:E2F/DP family winged-helix DNA-binding domain-containing protein n=1 Tax=Steinernema carpocapsae TaxID=34508 RepID=A0A4U5NJ81_STECR|nr:hypothetical protein L596_016825 [Steinernema carpocapsae]